LRGLVISRLVAHFEAADRGDLTDLQWLYSRIERRHPILRSLIIRRRAAIQKLDWDIKTVSQLPPGATEPQAEAQRQALRTAYDAIPNLREAIAHLALAEFRGFSILQIHRSTDLEPIHLQPLPQWHFVRSGSSGDFYWNEHSRSISWRALTDAERIGGAALPRADFIIRACPMPINEIGAITFVNSAMAKKDWAAFVEIFGLPGCIVEMPPNIPQGKETEYETTAQAVAEGGSGSVPNGAKPHFPTAAIRGNSPFKEFLDFEEKDLVLAGTGGLLTMLTAPTGIGKGPSEQHADAFSDIACAEAAEISETFQRQLDLQILEAQFPGQPVLAYFSLAPESQEDLDAIVERVVKLESAGYSTDPKEISEKTGLRLERKPQAAPSQISNLKSQISDLEFQIPNRLLPNGDTPGHPYRGNQYETVAAAAPARIHAARADKLLEMGFSETDASGASIRFDRRLKAKLDKAADGGARKEILEWSRETVRSGRKIERQEKGELRTHYGKVFQEGADRKGVLVIVDTADGYAFNYHRLRPRQLERKPSNRSRDDAGDQPPVVVLQALAAGGSLPDYPQPATHTRADQPQTAFLSALASDLAPLRRRLQRIIEIQDPDILRDRLDALRAELPSLLRDINADPASASALQTSLFTAIQTAKP
jgi:phage gp29-like protein